MDLLIDENVYYRQQLGLILCWFQSFSLVGFLENEIRSVHDTKNSKHN